MSLAAGYELNIHDHTWIFQVVGHRPEVWMPNQEPVGVEAKGVSEGAELASRSQGPECEDWNVDPNDSSQRLIVLETSGKWQRINYSKHLVGIRYT